jgi:hypothetical protein
MICGDSLGSTLRDRTPHLLHQDSKRSRFLVPHHGKHKFDQLLKVIDQFTNNSLHKSNRAVKMSTTTTELESQTQSLKIAVAYDEATHKEVC